MHEIQKNELNINYIGYLTAPIGLGSGARNYLSAFWQQGWQHINCIDMTYATGHLPTEKVPYFPLSSIRPAHINILHINAYDLPHMIDQLGKHYFQNSYNIGIWAWETDELPKSWHDRFTYLHEIWTLSDFVNRSIARFTLMPVLTIPYIVPHLNSVRNREKFSLRKDEFIFLFNFDYESVFYRKNPYAVINAFCTAFSKEDNARLVIKTTNSHKHLEIQAALLKEVKGANITFIDAMLSSADQHELIASCDAYISLHRAEGLGLGMAEAMSLGKPVIGTGWSGNLDFMNVTNSLLVKYDLNPIPGNISIYPAETVWASPHIEHAAALMRAVYLSPEQYQSMALQGQKNIRASFSSELIGSRLSARLNLIKTKILNNQMVATLPSIQKVFLFKKIWLFILKNTPVKYHHYLFYFRKIFKKIFYLSSY